MEPYTWDKSYANFSLETSLINTPVPDPVLLDTVYEDFSSCSGKTLFFSSVNFPFKKQVDAMPHLVSC